MVQISFKDLKVGEVKSSSGIFSETNFQYQWVHTKKINEGLGTISGKYNSVHRGFHYVNDQDIIDWWRRPKQ
jgi:hypothetical protein